MINENISNPGLCTDLEFTYLVMFETTDIDSIDDIDLLQKYGSIYSVTCNKHVSGDEYERAIRLINILQDLILERMK